MLLALAVLVVQLFLAWTAFNPAPHSGGDNAGYVALATSLLRGQGYTEIYDPALSPHTKFPPVFPALLALWIAAGARTWTALKTLPALFTTLAVLFVYLWVSRRRGAWFGAGVALLVAFSSAVLDASHWILSEPPFLAFTFLALWALDWRGAHARGGTNLTSGPVGATTEEDTARTPRRLSIAVGCAAAILAYFTRSAGLPLLVAVSVWLAWSRRWRALAAFGLAAGAPALAWWSRGADAPGPSYVGEFWMLDPYDPSLGGVGVSDLATRAVDNFLGYVTAYVPGGIVGTQGGWVAGLGVALAGLAAAGWIIRVRSELGVAEVFFPLYAGLILLWPQVWSGDRFALPLYPLIFYYGGEAVLRATGRWGAMVSRGALAAVLLAVLIPAMGGWARTARLTAACRAVVAVSGPFACYGAGVEQFVSIALWSGSALPEKSAVLSRKPRIFFVMSGVPSRTFPFSTDPDALLSEGERLDAGFVVLDYVDRQALRYVGEAVRARPGAFCVVGGFPVTGGGPAAQMLGILPDTERDPRAAPSGAVSLRRCPPAMGAVPPTIPTYSSWTVPILESEPSGR